MIRVPTGEILSYRDAYDRYGDQMDLAMQTEGGTPDFRTMAAINPVELYPVAVARFVLLYATLGLVTIVLTFAVVERRRP
jgi:hypothetical protein